MKALEGKKTYIAIAAIVVIETLRLFGVDLGLNSADVAGILGALGLAADGNAQNLALSIVTLVAAAVAVYGRFKAQPPASNLPGQAQQPKPEGEKQ